MNLENPLLGHEHFESRFEGIFKTDYITAHEAANRAGRPSGLEDIITQGVKNGFVYRNKKIKETGEEVFYSFCTSSGNSGKVGINKKTGECFIMEEPEWDTESKLAARVFRILSKYWRKGEFPDVTCWAS